MCGISGILSRSKIDPEIIRQMTAAIGHRGPDAQSVFIDDGGTVALGHTRLSIIDLSSAANQPMHAADGNLVIVFNGEIYNFKTIRQELERVNPQIQFKTQSDTETILLAFQQWGVSMVEKLEGMFAMAIHDKKKRKTYFFRDRLGKKPLFYFKDKDHFIFASEIKALLKHPKAVAEKIIDRTAITQFLHLGYIPAPRTIYQSIKKFPAGSWGVVDEHYSMKIQSFWNIDSYLADRKQSGGEKEQLKTLLHDAVKKRLISDVPLGAFLSGGTDSSLVVAIAAQYVEGPLKTFNIGFKESKYDESKYASLVAKQLKTDHHSFILSENEAIGILDTYLHHFDEPFADASAIPTMLVSQLTRQSVSVALTGDGGDELFLGYGAYDWANRLRNPLMGLFQNSMKLALRHSGKDRLKRVSRLLEKVSPEKLYSHIFSQEQYFFSDRELRSELLKHSDAYSSFSYGDSLAGLSGSERQAIFDLKFYLPDDLLVKVDRASMFYSLECRCPLLDHKVAEFALTLPYAYKKRHGESKWILKELLKEYLPDELIYRSKWGFGVPMLHWLKGPLRYLIDDYLNHDIVADIGIVKWTYVEHLRNSFFEGETHLYNRLWVLIVLHKWMKENG